MLNFAWSTDTNECENHDCSLNANCINHDGAYECVCKEGYAGDGKQCDGKTNY